MVNALEPLVTAYANAGFTDANCRFNPYCGVNLTAARVPVFRGGGADIDTNVNFIDSDYTPSGGLVGGSKYLDTTVAHSSLGGENTYHFGVYSLLSPTALGIQMGARNSDSQIQHLLLTDGTGKVISSIWSTSGGGVLSFAYANPTRFCLANRVSSTSHAFYSDGTLRGSSATLRTGTRPTLSTFVHARNNVGSPDGVGNHPLGGYSFGLNIPAASIAAVSAAWKTYSNAMGRMV